MWTRPLALAAGSLLLAAALPAFAAPLLLVAAVGCGWALAVAVVPQLRRPDAYDLGELRRVHEQEEVRALDDEGALGRTHREAPEIDGVVRLDAAWPRAGAVVSARVTGAIGPDLLARIRPEPR